MKYLHCPNCGKKGVYLKLMVNEDNYRCRYCDWYVFTGGESQIDVVERTNLATVNPDVEVIR